MPISKCDHVKQLKNSKNEKINTQIICDPPNIQVPLIILTVNSTIEQRLVNINLLELLTSENFTGIYKIANYFQPAPIIGAYYIVMKTERVGVWQDDSQISRTAVDKFYCGPGEHTGVDVAVFMRAIAMPCEAPRRCPEVRT